MRLFVAVPVPEELRAKAAALGEEIRQDGVVPVRPQNMHLTLRFLGDVAPQKLPEIKEKLGSVRFGRFGCALKGVGVFPNENYVRVVWAGCESGGGLEALAAKVAEALRGMGGDERFAAHLTIARVKKKLDLRAFLARHKDGDFGSFEAARFGLVESVLGGPKGPEYRTLAVYEAEK
ncbi:MAG: RNA 2',3'-cyclic phosphodiesterase [Candidatus Micrarchaeota archaeon]